MGTEKDKIPLQKLPPKQPPRAAPPTSNKDRRDRAKRADDARTQGPVQPKPIQLWDHYTVEVPTAFCVPTAPLSPFDVCFEGTEDMDLYVALPPIVFELFGKGELKPEASIRDQIWPDAHVPRAIPVKFGKFAAGEINVYKDSHDKLHTIDTIDTPQLLPFFHDAFPRIHVGEQPALLINIHDNVVTGELVMTTLGSTLAYITPVKRITGDNVGQILGLDDLQQLTAEVTTNELAEGHFTFFVFTDSFLLDGVFPQAAEKANFLHVADERIHFEVSADVAAKGVDKTTMPIRRDPLGGLLGKLPKLHGKLEPKKGHVLEGDLEANFARGKFDIRGHLKYTSAKPKITGEVFVQVTDQATARAAAAQKLGDLAPPEYALEEVPNGLAMWGWGSLDFAFNEWFTGRAEVVVDPDGFITTRGHIAPTKVFTLFKENKGERTIFEDQHTVYFAVLGVPARAYARLRLFFFWKVGPGVLGDIVVEGVYSTRPGITRRLSLAGTFGMAAKVGYGASLTGAVGVPILADAGLKFTGEAALEGKVAVRPRIGWIGRGRTNVDDDPVSGKYYVQGRAHILGNVAFGAKLDVFGRVGLPEFEIPIWGKRVDLSIKPSIELFKTSWKWKFLDSAFDMNYEVGKTVDGPKSLSRFDGGIDTDGLLDKMIHNTLASGGVTDAPTATYDEFVREGEMLKTETPPSPSLAEVETSTPTIAGGNIEADEFPSLTPGPATSPPPAPSTPPGVTSPDPDLPPLPEATPVPPIDPKNKMFEPPKTDDRTDLIITFQMSGQDHALYLNRSTEPGTIRLASPRAEVLWKQLRLALITIKAQINDAKRDGTYDGRTKEELEDEEEELTDIYDEVVEVQRTARSLGPELGATEVGGVAKPIPRHVPGFPPIADHLEAYGEEHDRSELPAATRVTQAPPPRDPRLAGLSTPRLDQLAAQDPDRAKRYIDEYADYVDNCAKPEVRTPQPIVTYLEGRAARKLGNLVEKRAIDRYNKEKNRSVVKNSREVELVHRRTGEIKKPATTSGKDRREPDFFVPGEVLGDIKHVQSQSDTQQMKDFALICTSKNTSYAWDARWKGTTEILDATPVFDLVVRETTHKWPRTDVSGPLKDAIKKRGGEVLYLIDDRVTEGPDEDDVDS